MSIIWELILNAKTVGFTTDTLNQTLWEWSLAISFATLLAP